MRYPSPWGPSGREDSRASRVALWDFPGSEPRATLLRGGLVRARRCPRAAFCGAMREVRWPSELEARCQATDVTSWPL
eukprot:5263052-Pyramimonas_sp.AAC.1